MGEKKSTVWTIAVSGVNRNTPASSALSKPTKTPGRFCRGRLLKAAYKSRGASLPAQPADLAYSVSLTDSFLYERLLVGSGTFFLFFSHTTLPVQGPTRVDDQNWSLNIAADASGGVDFDAALRFQITEHPA